MRILFETFFVLKVESQNLKEPQTQEFYSSQA